MIPPAKRSETALQGTLGRILVLAGACYLMRQNQPPKIQKDSKKDESLTKRKQIEDFAFFLSAKQPPTNKRVLRCFHEGGAAALTKQLRSSHKAPP